MQIFAACLSTLKPILRTVVAGPFGPYFVECGQMIGRIGVASAPTIGGKCNELVVDIDQRSHTVMTSLEHRLVKDVTCLGKIVDAGVIAQRLEANISDVM